VRLISNKLVKGSPNFIEKYYLLAELLIVEYRQQNKCVTNTASHK